MSKCSSLLLILVLAVSSLTVILATVPFGSAQTGNTSASAPSIQWQKECSDSGTEYVSNLIQTNDGGYAFLDLGWYGQFTFVPSTFYKLNSSGDVQWTKTIDSFTASSLIQTSDGGYEIFGYWANDVSNVGVGGFVSTVLKTDSEGNIQWRENYNISEPQIYPNVVNASLKIQTSDGGFASLSSHYNRIIKTDSNGNQQWAMNLVFPTVGGNEYTGYWTSIIETQDGALAVIGVGTLGNPMGGNIYLMKTEAFLPLPSQTPLPTPMKTPIPALETVVITVALTVVAVVGVSVGLLVYRNYRKKQLGALKT